MQRSPLDIILEATSPRRDRTYDPMLISLVRRSLPNLMAHDIVSVQPMSGPTGLIFAIKSKYESPWPDDE